MSDWDFLHEMRDRGYSADDIALAAAAGYAPWEEVHISRQWIDDELRDQSATPARSVKPKEPFKSRDGFPFARALVPTAGHASFLQAMVRDRVVADDWLVAIDGNRYSVPFMLIGKTVQVVREGGSWVVRYRGAVVAEHPVLAGRAQLSVQPAHGPGAAARNARQRYSAPRSSAPADLREVEVRDLAVYERLFGTEVVEAAA